MKHQTYCFYTFNRCDRNMKKNLIIVLLVFLSLSIKSQDYKGLWKVVANVFDGTKEPYDNLYFDVKNNFVDFLQSDSLVGKGQIINDTLFVKSGFDLDGIDWIVKVNDDSLISSPTNSKHTDNISYSRIGIIGVENDYQAFPTSNAIWQVSWSQSACRGECGLRQYFTNGDTIINNLNYTIINSIVIDYFIKDTFDYISAFIRNDLKNRRILMLDKSDTTNEKVLYDFNIEKGDTILHRGDSVILETIDTLELININLLRYNFSVIQNEEGVYKYSFSIIEGIGSSNGLFEGVTISYVNYHGSDLICFSNQDSIRYPNKSACTDITIHNCTTTNTHCDTSICIGDSIFLSGNFQDTEGVFNDTLVSIYGCDSLIITKLTIHDLCSSTSLSVSSFSESKIFPNPTDGIISFNFSQIVFEGNIHIYSICNKAMKTIKFAKSNWIEIDLTDFAPGVYFIKLSNEKEVRTFKVIKK